MFRELVRKKQQISQGECIEILKNEKRGVLSVHGDDGYPYGMPLNHYYCEEDGKLYFHSGMLGHKVDALRRNSKVSYCVYDEGYRKEGEWALNIRSVVAFGRISLVRDEEKAREIYRKEVTHWEETRQIISADILDGCFVRTLYLDALLGAVELTVDLGVYKRFLSKVTMDAKMQKRLAQNISYLSTALPVRTFRIPFRSLIREVEEQGYLLDSEQYFIIENAYRSVESYEYHEDNAVSAMMESFLSAESRAPMAGAVDADPNEKLTALSYEWYMTRYIENHGEEMLYVSEKYPHTYIRAVTFLDQLQTIGAEGMRNAILDKLETFDEIKVPRDALEAGMEEAYQKALRRKKEPVYLTEGSVTYKRTGKKILPNDPCPCGSGKKYKQCHGRK